MVLYPEVKPGGVIKADTQLMVNAPGSQKVIAVFDSNELRDITGSVLVEVFDEQ